ncbi:hypothetical protein TUBRATIS_21050 [Tubulinosema ratisbonensis]|uniref:MULE domain-containing protein n=1 Tax=Tubulinosema ratisbonensis TaxID=291195 RepID=A0A437AK08_9MICR|nr:hypothetical protein TUBRATIS_21050 [Tubulinosema ratisbonensis]
MFYLGQSIFRKTQYLGLQNIYNIDKNIKKYCKCLVALSFVKIDKLRGTFNEIKTCAQFPVILSELYSYFYDNYIGELCYAPKYPTKPWHYGNILNENIVRTNNTIEGWHSVFKTTFNSSKNSLHQLIEKLKFEEDAIRIKSTR